MFFFLFTKYIVQQQVSVYNYSMISTNSTQKSKQVNYSKCDKHYHIYNTSYIQHLKQIQLPHI